jgi:general secretion pathway protein N
MKLRTLLLIVLGLVAFGVILVVTMPASFIASQVGSSLPPQVTIDGAKGNMWAGEASVRAAPGGVPITIEKVQWRFKPSRLADGKIAFDTSATSGGFEAKMELQRDGTRWHVRDLRVDGDASGFATIFPILAAYKFLGPVTLTAASLDGNEHEVWGDAKIEWRDAGTALSQVRPLGTFRAEWHGDGASGRINASTLAGPLRVSGAGTTGTPARLDFSGEAGADASAGLSLDPLLDQIGQRKPNGARAIEIRLR